MCLNSIRSTRWNTSRHVPKASSQVGVTLIDLMIAIAIVSLLVSIALPSYLAYVRRGVLQEAFAQMSNFQLKMEQHYKSNRSYKDTIEASKCPTALVASLGSKYFTFICTLGATPQNYALVATGKGSAAGYDYGIDHANNRKTRVFAGTDQTELHCWADRFPACD